MSGWRCAAVREGSLDGLEQRMWIEEFQAKEDKEIITSLRKNLHALFQKAHHSTVMVKRSCNDVSWPCQTKAVKHHQSVEFSEESFAPI